jgi:hypothetical protein
MELTMLDEIISELKFNPFLILKHDELNILQSEAKLVREENTFLCDFIRVFDYKNNILVQETSDKNEIILRPFDTIDRANEFVQERLAFYERKWDGCGCKVDYYS